jgi:signal transduction histidine kinase
VTWLSCGFAVAGALALAGATLRAARARLTGATAASWQGATLLVAAVALLSACVLPGPSLRLVLLAPVLVVHLAGRRPTRARRAPDRKLVAAAAGGVPLLAALLSVAPVGPHALWLAADSATAACCVVATAVALGGAVDALRQTYAAHGSRILQLADDLGTARRRIAELEEGQRARLHEARTAVLGVLGATHLFAVPTEAGEDDDSAAQLRRVVTAEARRLTTLLDPESDEEPREFALASAFEPVLVAYRATGMRIDADLRGLRAYGRPTATATVLANLLSNAAKYAPGSPVVVRASSAGASVRICVEDSGPGIPAEVRSAVLIRGERLSRSAAAGTGIGLYSSAVAMAEQGGSLRIEGRAGLDGTRVVLGLPAAVLRPVGPLRANAS